MRQETKETEDVRQETEDNRQVHLVKKVMGKLFLPWCHCGAKILDEITARWGDGAKNKKWCTL